MAKAHTPTIMPWLGIGADAFAMWTDASLVIGMRAAKVAAGGPAAQRELGLMITEKMQAAAEMQAAAASGALGHDMAGAAAKAMAIYAPKVRANRKRLAGS